MTEEEGELLHKIVDEYYLAFSKLVNQTLAKVPEHLYIDAEYMLQEHSSVFGRKTET